MKFVEQLRVWGRAERRRRLDQARARRLPLPGLPIPARLDLCLDDLGTPKPTRADASLEVWEARIIAWVMACGPVPLRVVGRAGHPLLAELARFSWRLECPVQVRTTARGLTASIADALVDAGVKRVTLVDEDGESAGGSSGADGPLASALRALRDCRTSRNVKVDLVVELPFDQLVRGDAAELSAASTLLRSAGADGLRVGAPWHGGPWEHEAVEALTHAREWIASFHRTDPALWRALSRYDGGGPGAPRAHGRCPVAGLRLALSPDGTAYACPFQPGAVPMGDDVPAALAGLADHHARIHACDRTCVHAELTA